MKQVSKISVKELREMAEKMYGGLVKAVADVEKNILVVDAEMHADEEQYLLEQGSEQKNLWGFNLYPDKFGADDFIEYDSMINIRPRANNMNRGVGDPAIREKIVKIVQGAVHE
jgi:hypothetical protein